MPSDLTLIQLWKLYRGAEDAMRYYGDMIGSLIALREGTPDENRRIEGLDPEALAILHLDWDDPPPCRPPWCITPPTEACAYARRVAMRIHAIAEATCALTNQVSSDIRHYASTVPGRHWK